MGACALPPRPGSKQVWAGRAQRAQLFGLVLRLSFFFFFLLGWELGNEVIFAPVPPGGCLGPDFKRVCGRAHVFAVAPGCARKASGALRHCLFSSLCLRWEHLSASADAPSGILTSSGPTNHIAVPGCAHREPLSSSL